MLISDKASDAVKIRDIIIKGYAWINRAVHTPETIKIVRDVKRNINLKMSTLQFSYVSFLLLVVFHS